MLNSSEGCKVDGVYHLARERKEDTGERGAAKGLHAFGEADGWGAELFGVDNALVGNWPVVVNENGKAVIKELGNIPEWWSRHGDLLVMHMDSFGQMHYQRG